MCNSFTPYDSNGFVAVVVVGGVIIFEYRKLGDTFKGV